MTDTSVLPTSRTAGRAAAPTVQVFLRDGEAEAALRQAMANIHMRDAEFIRGDVDTAITMLSQRPSPRLLVVEVGGGADPAARINALADVCEPNTGVIVVGERNDIVLYRDLKRAGVAEYFFKPLVADLVARACTSVLAGTTEPAARTGKLVLVLGVRGGVGATTVAVNTAWHLAEQRQRWVMLLDLDLQNGDAALQLDEAPTHALREAVEHPERVVMLFLERAVTPVEKRVDLLASLAPLADSIAFASGAVPRLLTNLLQRYRFVFADVPPALAAQVLPTLTMPAVCVLVSAGTLTCARDVARWRDWFAINMPDRVLLHVLNRNGAPDALPEHEFVRAAGHAPDVRIPYDREIAAASILGIRGTQKCAPLRRGLAPLLRQLSGEQAAPSRSLFGRWF
jgi:pilus assembly protein CpaE